MIKNIKLFLFSFFLFSLQLNAQIFNSKKGGLGIFGSRSSKSTSIFTEPEEAKFKVAFGLSYSQFGKKPTVYRNLGGTGVFAELFLKNYAFRASHRVLGYTQNDFLESNQIEDDNLDIGSIKKSDRLVQYRFMLLAKKNIGSTSFYSKISVGYNFVKTSEEADLTMHEIGILQFGKHFNLNGVKAFVETGFEMQEYQYNSIDGYILESVANQGYSTFRYTGVSIGIEIPL